MGGRTGGAERSRLEASGARVKSRTCQSGNFAPLLFARVCEAGFQDKTAQESCWAAEKAL